VPTVLILTTDNLPHPDLDTPPLTAALQARGAEVLVEPWHTLTDAALAADVALIRTTWDYFDRVDEFTRAVHRLPMPVHNPAAIVEWNSHKGYLVDLSTAGVPVVPTTVLRRGSPAVLPFVDAVEVVIKPAVDGGGRGVGRFTVDSPDAGAHLAWVLERDDALVQPFEPTVSAGERSLIYLAGSYSHAVRKIPAEGDYRVQVQHGGQNHPYVATGADIEVAEQTLAAVPGGTRLLYARIDLVGEPNTPVVMELEVIEPELFLPLAPGAADRVAEGLLALL